MELSFIGVQQEVLSIHIKDVKFLILSIITDNCLTQESIYHSSLRTRY